VDAAIFEKRNCYEVEMCLRDTRGQFIKAQTLGIHAIPLAQEAKAWSLKLAHG
jgi:hypothetical protein